MSDLLKKWNGRTFGLVVKDTPSDPSCVECHAYTYIEQFDDHCPCEAMGDECCEIGNENRVWKETAS